MVKIVRSSSSNPDFLELVKELDAYLAILDGDDAPFYAKLNKTETIKHVIVAYHQDQPIGCGAIREYTSDTMEVKRMFTRSGSRNSGVATKILMQLEAWAKELNYSRCILETGKRQPDAIALYTRNGYHPIPNYGKYAGIPNSICFEKEI